MSTDAPDLARRIRERDPEALESVVRAYLGQILRAARGAGLDASAAEDVTQATLTTFLERAADFEGRSQVRTWLFGILYRKIAEARRKGQRDNVVDDIDATMEARFSPDGTWVRPPRTADGELQDREIRERLHGCMESLPEKQRSVFLLREVEGFETSEVCKILDVSVTNLGVLFFRARNRLRECLEAGGFRRAEAGDSSERPQPNRLG